MGDYLGTLNLNSRKKPVAQYSEGVLKGGIRKEQLSEKSRLIFDAINNQDASKGNVDEILDANEIQNFWDKLCEFAKDDTLGGREANRVLKDLGLKEFKKEDLYAFINELYGESEYVDSSFVDENDGTIVINYKEDEAGNTVQERVHTDKTSEIETTDSDKTVTTHFFDSQSHLTKETVVNANNDSETILYTDAEGNVVLDDENNSVPTHVSRVINKDGLQTTAEIEYTEGKPSSAVAVEGEKTSNYIYQDELPVLTNTVENLGNNLQRTINYEYTENGHIEHITEPDKTIDKTIVNFTTEDNKVVPLTTKEVIKQGTTTTTNDFDYQNSIKYETIAEEGGRQTQNIYAMVPDEEGGVTYAKLQQTKVVDGKTYQVQYDGQGNTCGIVVQNGESPAAIAQKFGCSIKILFAVNADLVHGKGNKRYFNVGEEIKIPNKELDADARVLQGRDSREVAIAKYQQYLAEQEYKKQLTEMGWDGTDFRQGETIEYGGETYTILGRKTNRARLLVQDSEGRVYTASHDDLILRDSYVATTDYYDFNSDRRITMKDGSQVVKAPENIQTDEQGNQYVEIRGYRFPASYGNGVDGHRDQYGRDVVIDYNGNLGVASGTIDLNNNQGRYILDPDYLSASDQVVAGTASKRNCYGVDGVQSVTVNGKTFYFNGVTQQDGEEVEASIADAVYNDVRDASKGIGTKEDLLRQAVSGIHTPTVLAKVNSKFAGSEFDKNNGYNALENQILDEENHGNAQEHYFQVMINNGAYDTDNTARIGKQELNHELHDRFMGYTSTAGFKRAMGLINTPEARRELETTYGFNIETELASDGTFLNRWDSIEIRGMQSVWVKNNAYEMATLQLDAQGNPVLDENGKPVYENAADQTIRNEVIGDLISNDDKEYILIGLDAINTDNFISNGPSADYLFFENKAAELCAERGYQQQYEYQTAGQQFIAGISTDNGTINTQDVRTYNTRLYNDKQPIEAQTASIIYEIRQGNFKNVFESTDPAVYEELTIQLACDQIPGCKSLRDLYDKALEKTENTYEKTKLTLSVAASGQSTILSSNEIVSTCVIAMKLLDNEYKSLDHLAEANLMIEQLTKIISDRPDLKDRLLFFIKNGAKSYLTTKRYVAFGNDVVENRSGYWASFVDNVSQNALYESAETVFFDDQGQLITDAALIDTLKIRNNEVVKELETYLAQLERDFKISVDDEGDVASLGRSIASLNVDMRLSGTYEEDMKVIYTQIKNILPKLKLAANGQLRDSNGRVVSCKDLLESFQQQLDFVAQKNNDFVTTGQYAKMGVILAPVILTTIVASGGAAAAGWGTLGVAGVAGGTTFVTEYGLNTIDAMTSQNGLTREKNAENLWRAVTDSALAASGVAYSEVLMGTKFTSVLNKIKLTNPNIQNVTKLTSVIIADTTAGAAGEYVLTGDVTIEGVAYNAIFSATGNLIALRQAGRGTTDGGASNSSSSQSVLDVATVDGTAPIGGRLSNDKFTLAVDQTSVEIASGVTPQRHAQLLDEAGSLRRYGSRSQGRQIQHVVEDGTGVFTSKHGDIDLNTETDIAKLREFRKEVAGWDDPNRDIDGIFAMINDRIEHLNAHPELIGTPAQSQVLDLYNTNLVEQTDALLAPNGKNGKNFRIGESDASLIIERINKTNSLDDLDAIVAGIEHRRLGGTRQDLIDDMLRAVDSRRLQLRPEIDMDGFSTLIAAKKAAGKGLSEGELFDVVRLIENSSDAEFAQIETLLNSCNKKIKNHSQIKNALELRRNKVTISVESETVPKITEEPVLSEYSIIHESDPVVSQRSEFLEQQFKTKLEESDIWQTARTQHSVDRLGGEKLRRYTAEFEDLCRYATTPEQLDELQLLANKFRGQAENTSFNMSIAKRRAKLNNTPATEIRVNDHEIIMDAPRTANNDEVPVIEVTNTPVVKKT